jgi:hypothetical protein
MTKAILLLDPQGVAQVPAILCAENAEEAQAHNIPLFTAVFAQLIAGMDLSPNGEDYDLFENGKRIGTLEIFTPD